MQAVLFYLSYPFLYLLASLPFNVLYLVSDGLYFILKLSGYRKSVVKANLRNSFPEKSDAEINDLCNSFFRYLCDLILETLKTMKMTESEIKERCLFEPPEWLMKLYIEKKSIIVVLGHYGNWEWAGPSFSINSLYQLVVIYRPLSNPYFEKMMVHMRTRFGTQITEAQQTLRRMIADKGKLTATAFIADQTASPESAYWTTFLNQDTAVFNGPEKLARKFEYPVVYFHVSRPRRGYYELKPELLFEHPGKTSENEILETFTRKLETDILKNPTIWLWSHRRWKHHRNKK